MPARRLTIFDILADLIPGIIFLLFLFPLFALLPLQLSQLGPLSSSIVLLAVGYTVGRLIHATAARPCLEDKIEGMAWWAAENRFFASKQIQEAILQEEDTNEEEKGDSEEQSEDKEKDNEEGDGGQDRDEEKNQNESRKLNFQTRAKSVVKNDGTKEWNPPLEHKVLRKLISDFEDKFDSHFTLDPETEDENQWESDYEYLEHLGHSVLHKESTLYRRYTILTTFYRNLWVAIVFGTMVIAIEGVLGTLVGSEAVSLSYSDFLLGLFPALILVIAVLILSVRWLEFRYRRLRALINDLYLKVSEGSL